MLNIHQGAFLYFQARFFLINKLINGWFGLFDNINIRIINQIGKTTTSRKLNNANGIF